MSDFESKRVTERRPWINEDGSTNVDGFLVAYAADDNTFWRVEQGHIMNVVDALIERTEQNVTLLEVLNEAFRQNYHLDHSNAAIHCAPVRYSPLTFRLAEQINQISPVHVESKVWEVLLDKGAYEEDKGR